MINLAMLLPHIDGAGGAIAMLPAALTLEDQLQAAREEASDAADARFALQLEQVEAANAEKLTHLRKQWCSEEAAALASRLLGHLSEAEHRLADAIQTVLAPFIETLLPRAAVIELRQSLLSDLGSDLKQQITLQGPKDLVDALSASLAAHGADNIRTGAATPELQADCNGLLTTTRLAVWCAAIGEAEHG